MTSLGSMTFLWNEDRFLPLVLEQMMEVPGPRIVIWNDRPMMWLGEGKPPFGHQNAGIAKALLAAPPEIEVWKVIGGMDDKSIALGLSLLSQRGVEVAFCFASDFLYTLQDVRIMAAAVAGPATWVTQSRSFWGNWEHTFDRNIVPIAYSTRAGFPLPDGAHKKLPDEVMLFHPSWVKSDTEVWEKMLSWGHAQLAQDQDWYERFWLDGRPNGWEPTDIKLPREIYLRLLKHGCLAGIPKPVEVAPPEDSMAKKKVVKKKAASKKKVASKKKAVVKTVTKKPRLTPLQKELQARAKARDAACAAAYATGDPKKHAAAVKKARAEATADALKS